MKPTSLQRLALIGFDAVEENDSAVAYAFAGNTAHCTIVKVCED